MKQSLELQRQSKVSTGKCTKFMSKITTICLKNASNEISKKAQNYFFTEFLNVKCG
jgi:hypothetical protein